MQDVCRRDALGRGRIFEVPGMFVRHDRNAATTDWVGLLCESWFNGRKSKISVEVGTIGDYCITIRGICSL